MSALDIDIGRHVLAEVNRLRTGLGRWPLQENPELSQWAWNHLRWMLWEGGSIRHPPNGELDGQAENICMGHCTNPYLMSSRLICYGDSNHMFNFLREDICAHGVAVYTSEFYGMYWLLLTWRARKNNG